MAYSAQVFLELGHVSISCFEFELEAFSGVLGEVIAYGSIMIGLRKTD